MTATRSAAATAAATKQSRLVPAARARVGVVGAGYWGPNLIRNLAELTGSPLAAVCDRVPDRLEYVRRRYPGVQVYESFDELVADPGVDAVVIATPAETHARLAAQALAGGKHVFVEKPLATSSAAGRELAALAEVGGLVLMVGHTFLHNDAVRWTKAKIDSGDLGDVLYLYSRRLNLGQVRQDINVVWNLAPHDVSIMLYLLGERPQRVTCAGHCFLQPGVEDVAFLTLEFSPVARLARGTGEGSGARRAAHIHVSWLDPNKVREVVVVGTRKMVVYDDVDPDHMIQVYDKGVDRVPTGNGSANGAAGGAGTAADPRERAESFGEFKLLLRTGDLTIPKIRFTEPLRNEMAHFVDCVETGKRPLTDAQNGLDVVRVLEAADESLRRGGAPVEIDWEA
ncbi:MAG: Gfo/Idh/MocA family oxidoreductase [Chloroflexi bacterium]|nr:Gfo/Idh/MocA family oxidoreductase [Chloroflexota bacterium]